MRTRLAILALAALLTSTGCANAADPRPLPTVGSSNEGTASGSSSTNDERFPTAPQSTSNTCVTASEGNVSEFESVTLSADATNLIATFEFERPYVLGPGEPNSVAMQRPERIIVLAGPIRAYAFLSPDHEEEAISYVIRDDVLGGDLLPGASLVKDGNVLALTVPLPADITPYADVPAQWRVEAQGVDCPAGPGYDSYWLWTDVLMANG